MCRPRSIARSGTARVPEWPACAVDTRAHACQSTMNRKSNCVWMPAAGAAAHAVLRAPTSFFGGPAVAQRDPPPTQFPPTIKSPTSKNTLPAGLINCIARVHCNKKGSRNKELGEKREERSGGRKGNEMLSVRWTRGAPRVIPSPWSLRCRGMPPPPRPARPPGPPRRARARARRRAARRPPPGAAGCRRSDSSPC